MQNFQLINPVQFHCHEKISRKSEEWEGVVTNLINHGSHYEIQISSRSGFTFIVGKYINGSFISIPAFDVGSDLAGFGDYFWNHEHLSRIMNQVDAATIAQALKTLKQQDYI